MQVLAFGLLVLAAVASAGNVDFRDCPSANLATIITFGVSGCDDGASSCTFVKGETYEFTIAAQSHDNSPVATALPYKVTGTVLGLPITLLEGNACDNMTSCPIEPSEHILWSVEKEIGSSTPAISNVVVTARIWSNTQGTNAQAAACAQFTVTIRNPSELKSLVESLRRQ